MCRDLKNIQCRNVVVVDVECRSIVVCFVYF
jgi:hypothetical protein